MAAMFTPWPLELLLLSAFVVVPAVVVVVIALSSRGKGPANNPNLAPCPDCGNFVSLRAISCPMCGCPLKNSPRGESPFTTKQEGEDR